MVQDGDSRFIGLDMRRDPASVAEGYYTIGEHVSCEDGTVKTRKGNIVVPWGDTYQYTDQQSLRAVEKHGTIRDAIRFADTVNQRDYLMLLRTDKAILCLPGATASVISFPANYTAADGARLIQAFDKVFLINGSNGRPLVWDGNVTSDFEFADTGSLAGGYEYFPRSRVACYHKNRLWVQKEASSNSAYTVTGGGSTVLPSDILESDFKSVNEFYVNQGDSDEIKALVPYTNDRIIAFKNNSMYSLDNLTGDLSNASTSLISNNIGIIGDRTAQVLGAQMIWLSRKGVMMAQLVQEQRLTPDTIPLSEPIEPIIRRINWPHASKSVSVIHNDRYYLAVPIDGQSTNNCVMVYNFKNQAWESIDLYGTAVFKGRAWVSGETYSEGFGPQTLNVIQFSDRETLISTTHAGCVALYRWNDGKADMAIEGTDDLTAWLDDHSSAGSTTEFVRQSYPFTSIVQTRGYLGGDPTSKKGAHIDLTIDTCNPEFSVDLVASGPGESESLLTDKTRDRIKRRDYANSATTTVINNASNEHQNPYLDDYSIHLYSAYNGQVTSAYPQFYFGNGSTIDDVYVNRPQEFNERFRVYKRVRAPRIKLTNTQGYLTLKGVTIKEYTRNRNHRREV